MNLLRPLLAGVLALLSLAVAPSAFAQDATNSGEDRPVTRLTPEPDDRVASGKATFLQGRTDALGVRFDVEGLDVLQPVTVALYTRSPDDDVRLQIVKGNWDAPIREARTGSGRIAEFNFRTFDGFNIRVDAEHPTDYQLVVWVGDALPEEPPPIAVPASEYRETATVSAAPGGGRDGAVSLSYLEIGLIVALLVVAGVLVALLLRRKSS